MIDFKFSIMDNFNTINRISKSVRDFTTMQINNEILTDRQFPINIPSYNANAVMDIFSNNNVDYKEVSINPTNRSNVADRYDHKIIRKLESENRSAITMLRYDPFTFKQYRPIYVDSVSCLNCHSSPSSTSKNQTSIYGSVYGYGYELGDIYGAKVLTIKASPFFIKHFCILLLFSIISYRTISRLSYKLYIDSHTHSYNKNYYIKFKLIYKRYSGYLFVIDIDDFKQINDIYGHDLGDQVLACLCQEIKFLTTKNEKLFRTGGEEFVLFSPNINQQTASKLASRINTHIERINFYRNSVSLNFTLSIGYTYKAKNESFDTAFMRADAALYQVKKSGKNNHKLA